VIAHEQAAVTLEHVLHPQPGYPFTLRLRLAYRLDDRGLAVDAVAENAGSEPCPFGLGFHPYLAANVDELELAVPARTRIAADERGVEQRREPSDLRDRRQVGDRRLDATYTDLDRDTKGLARVHAGDVVVWCDEAFPYLQVFSGDLPQIRRRGLAVEPMTCAPNAFASGDGLLRLAPGERFAGRWGIMSSARM
jgi:aldose 1-epimerase